MENPSTVMKLFLYWTNKNTPILNHKNTLWKMRNTERMKCILNNCYITSRIVKQRNIFYAPFILIRFIKLYFILCFRYIYIYGSCVNQIFSTFCSPSCAFGQLLEHRMQLFVTSRTSPCLTGFHGLSHVHVRQQGNTFSTCVGARDRSCVKRSKAGQHVRPNWAAGRSISTLRVASSLP